MEERRVGGQDSFSLGVLRCHHSTSCSMPALLSDAEGVPILHDTSEHTLLYIVLTIADLLELSYRGYIDD